MNQFKKAKQLKSETGHVIESITDLKTAGVSQKPKNSESSTTSIISADQASENSIKILDSHPDTLETPAQLIQDKVTVPSTTESIIVATKDQSIISPKSLPNYATSSQNNIISNVISSKESEIIEPNIAKSLNIIKSENNDIIAKDIIPSISTNQAEDKTISSPKIVQPHNELQQSQEITVIKHSKTSKKSIPNIFSPKGEAKSMRKSLVLKPSSVKIAEDYCVKNGGSFNELIQTLLDNFINEYGL